VSHIDIFATILDYLGASKHDKSDGKSLRRYIEQKHYKASSHDGIVVAEMSEKTEDRRYGSVPYYMIRKGSYKLMLPRARDSAINDMMYDLKGEYSQHTFCFKVS